MIKIQKLTLLLSIIMMGFVLSSSAAPDIYKPIVTTDASLSATVFATGNTNTMDVTLTEGKLHVSDTIHGNRSLKLLNQMLINRLDGYNGESFMVHHENDAGVIDSSQLVNVIPDENGFVYMDDVEFSTVIIDGYAGTYETTSYNLTTSDSMSLGQTFNGSKTTSLTATVVDDATKSHPYDINTTGLVLDLRMDDNLTDMSGNGNNGTAYGDTHFVNGKYNNGSSFDGVDDYVNCGNGNSLDIAGSHTVSVWVKIYSHTNGDLIITRRPANKYNYDIDQTSQKFRYTLYDGTNIPQIVATNTFDLNKWYYITAVRNIYTQKIYLYINGILDKSITDTTYGNVISGSATMIISSYAGYSTDGIIDSVRIYNRSLSATEINSLYLDNLEQFQVNTSANLTYSTMWNSSSDNPLSIPFTDGDLFNALNFKVPDSIVQNGITIYDYSSTCQFDITANVGYTEDTTKIQESAVSNLYTLNISHTVLLNASSGHINYTTANAAFLNADIVSTATLDSNNPNASVVFDEYSNFNISTGALNSGDSFNYNVSVQYGDVTIYIYNTTSGSYTANNGDVVQPNQGVLVHTPFDFDWGRSV